MSDGQGEEEDTVLRSLRNSGGGLYCSLEATPKPKHWRLGKLGEGRKDLLNFSPVSLSIPISICLTFCFVCILFMHFIFNFFHLDLTFPFFLNFSLFRL